MRTLLLIPLLVLPAWGGSSPAPNWDSLAGEILQHYTALLRLDTTNPPGNETRAARYLKQVLDEAGVPNRLLALEPERANLVARLKGTGRKRPILLMGHTDVVGVQREKWTVEPFAAVRSKGFIYGRGSTDDKDSVVAGMMVMLLLKKLDVALDRDVIFVAEAGEEGATRYGIDYLIEKHWPEINAEFAFAEGGGGVSQKGQVHIVSVTTTEKVPRTIELRAQGTSGHGSVPRADNLVSRLARAINRISSMSLPVRLNETTRTYFERMAAISSPELAAHYRDVLDPVRAPAAARYFARREPVHASMIRTTIVPTVLRAGFRENVIPSEGEALLDIRALPDEDMAALLARLRQVVDDPGIEVVQRRQRNRPAAPASRLDTEAFQALERVQKRLYPAATTLPSMMTGATDLAQLRAKGVQCYGIGPVTEVSELNAHGAHADDERLSEASLVRFVEYLWNVTLNLAAAQ